MADPASERAAESCFADRWRDKVVLRQRVAPSLINSVLVLGENDYADDMLEVEEV